MRGKPPPGEELNDLEKLHRPKHMLHSIQTDLLNLVASMTRSGAASLVYWLCEKEDGRLGCYFV